MATVQEVPTSQSGTTNESSIEWLDVLDDPELGDDKKFPLTNVTKDHAVAFFKRFKRKDLCIEQDVFVRGVLALRSQSAIDDKFEKYTSATQRNTSEQQNRNTSKRIRLRLGEHEFTAIETKVLYDAWRRERFGDNKTKTLKILSRSHWLLIFACIFAAMTQGWDQASMAGAAIGVMNNLGRPIQSNTPGSIIKRSTDIDIDLDYNTWLLGVTVGAPFFAGAIIGLVLTDPVSRIWRFGRRGAICLSGIFSLISVIGSASVHKWEHLLGFRILLGAGMAGKASIVPILLSETSPKNVRGILLVFWQLFVAFGLAAGSIANLSVYRLNAQSSWRYMFIAAIIPALLLISLILFSPESPRWLLKESGAFGEGDIPNKHSDRRERLMQAAFESLVVLRGEPVPIIAAGEIFLLHTRLIDEHYLLQKELPKRDQLMSLPAEEDRLQRRLKDNIPHVRLSARVKLMFLYSGFLRRAHFAAAAVMLSQQLCGINLLAFISDTFLRASKFDHDGQTTPEENMQLLGFSLWFMFLNFVATIIALPYIDKSNGRRTLLNVSFPGMAISLLCAALVRGRAVESSNTVFYVYSLFLSLFTIAYSIGEGPAAFVISAEVFPLVNRELGMSLAVFWNFMGAGTLALVSPALLKGLGHFGVMLFSGLNLFAWFLCCWLVPYTGGNEPLEDVFAQLDIPTMFLFTYTLRVLLRQVTRPVDYFLNCRTKHWVGCGYGGNLGTAREEYDKAKTRNGTRQRSNTSLMEMQPRDTRHT